MEPTACPRCERGNLIPKGGPGRLFPLRGFAELELPEDVLLPTCDFCGEAVLGPNDAPAFDAGMQRALHARLARIISESIEAVTQTITQQDLERLLGVSKGYVSKLKTGKDSSRVMAALLGMLANDRRRIDELRDLWSARKAPERASMLVSIEHIEKTVTEASARERVPSPGPVLRIVG